MASGVSLGFTGSSKFSSDFQQVLTRAVGIASLPLTLMQKDQDRLNSQRSALQGLQSTFSTLQSAITNLGTASKGSLQALSSDPSAVSAHTSAGALDGTYGIEVTGLGAATTTLSTAGLTTVTDASVGNISGASSFTLTINGSDHTISPSGNSLQSLAAALNDAGLGVQATILNAGTTASPDYRLSITSNHYAADTIQLKDGSTDLLSTLSTGSAVTYKVSGLATVLQSDSRTVTLSPGLTVDLLKANPGQAITVRVSHDYAVLENGLSGLAAAYNQASQALGQQHGKGAGPLAGQSLVFSLEDTLRGLTQYLANSGAVTTLTDLGLSLGQDGVLTFDHAAFSGASPRDIQSFLGDTASGGFLQTAKDALAAVSDNASGTLFSRIDSLNKQIDHSTDLIAAQEERISVLQANLQLRLAQADAAIAVLEGQVTYMTNLFDTLFLSSSKKNQ